MVSTSKEDDDEETEDFLNRSEQLLDLHGQGFDIAENVKKLRLPKVPTEGMIFIYSELKKLTEQHPESSGSSPIRTPSPRPEQFRPVSAAESHRCKCVHVVLPKKNDGLQAKDFIYLILFAIIGLMVYLYLYSPDYRSRQPIY